MKNLISLLFSAALLAGTLALPARAADAPHTLDMRVDGLVCAFCAQGIDKKLRALDAVADVYVSLERHRVAVALKPGQTVTEERLRELLTEAGYTLRSVHHSEQPLSALRAAADKP